MAGPVTNLTASALDQATLPNALDRATTPSAQDDNSVGWFLPGNSTSLQSIDGNLSTDLQGATPEGIADQVISHIGA